MNQNIPKNITDAEFGQIKALCDIRMIVDPTKPERLMQPELVDQIRADYIALQVAAVAMQMVWCLGRRSSSPDANKAARHDLADLLERHNEWRRGVPGAQPSNPKEITAAINSAIQILRKAR